MIVVVNLFYFATANRRAVAIYIHYISNHKDIFIMNKNMALMIAGIVFSIVSLLHLFRSLLTLEIVVAGYILPMWVSWVGFVVTFILSVIMFTARRNTSLQRVCSYLPDYLIDSKGQFRVLFLACFPGFIKVFMGRNNPIPKWIINV